MSDKYLTESGWKTTIQKYKVTDNGLLKALAAYEKLGDDKHEEKVKALDNIDTLADKLKTTLQQGIKTAQTQKAKPEVIKNLMETIDYLGEIEKATAAARKQEQSAAKAAEPAEPEPQDMLERLVNVAQTISGEEGTRLKKVMAIASKMGPSYKSRLWFYNYEAVGEFVQFHTNQERRAEMTKGSNGKVPFKGDSAGHGQWQIFPFNGSLQRACPKGCADKNLVVFLKWMDGQILYSVNKMSQVQHAGDATGGGSAFGPSVDEFLRHVGSLAHDSNSLYSAGY